MLVLEGAAPEWLRRVRGQLSDLPVAIKSGTASVQGLEEPELGERLRELAGARGAALVAWLSVPSRAAHEGANDGVSVSIWFAESGHSYTRLVARHWSRASAADRSGALEIGALSVRSAVRSLILDPASDRDPFAESAEAASSAGGGASSQSSSATTTAGAARTGGATTGGATTAGATTNGSAASTVAGGTAAPGAGSSATQSGSPVANASSSSSVASTAKGAPQTARAASAAPAPPEEEPQIHISLPTVLDRTLAPDTAPRAETASTPLELHWSNELGVVGRFYGEPALGAMAFEAGLHAASGPIRLGMLADLALPTVSQVGGVQLEVWRYALLVEGQYAAWQAGAWSVRPLVRVGAALIRHETTSNDPSILGTTKPQTHASPVIAAGALAEFHLNERLGISFRGLVQAEPLAPAYSITAIIDPDKTVTLLRTTQWPIQPMIELAANWYW